LASVKLCLNGGCEMESDIFDAALRRFRQIDDAVYSVGTYGRWRHFFESDFLVNSNHFFTQCFFCMIMDMVLIRRVGCMCLSVSVVYHEVTCV
jgi:hypothetical protein